ncbi:MAG TPA: SCP2 sterol-binding domain-containing protein [Micromonosporaceae bacterium]
MSVSTMDFFTALTERGPEPALAMSSGTVRFDLDRDGHTRHWLVRVDRGVVSASEADQPADAEVHTDESVFERLITGRTSPLTTVLRGAATIEGEVGLLVRLLRVFPIVAGERGWLEPESTVERRTA